MRPEFTKKPEFMLLAAQQKRNESSLFGETLRFLLVFLAASTVAGIIGSIPMLVWMFSGGRLEQMLAAAMQSNDPYALTNSIITLLEQMLGSMPGWLIAIVVASGFVYAVVSALYCKVFEKRNLASMGLVKQHALRSYLVGAVLGALSFAAVAGLAYVFKGITFDGINPLASIWPTLLMMFIAYVLQSAGEELLVRGYFMVSLSKRFRLPLCIGLSSILFGTLHVANLGINFLAFLNIALVGVVLALYILLTGDLWGACGYHALWNFCQGNVFDLPVSGTYAADSIFAVTVNNKSELLTGGDFGLEGSLCSTFVLLASLGVLIFLLLRRPADPVPENPA